MTYHFDGHSLGRRIIWLFLLNDPGVVTSYRVDKTVDRLGYVTGYGVSMMVSWLSSTFIGFNLATVIQGFDLATLAFGGPLVMATMMMLFIKGYKGKSTPWMVSGVISLILFEIGAPNYLILLGAVGVGVAAAIVQQRVSND